MDPKSSAVDPYPEFISMHGNILLPSFMLLTKSARFGPLTCCFSHSLLLHLMSACHLLASDKTYLSKLPIALILGFVQEQYMIILYFLVCGMKAMHRGENFEVQSLNNVLFYFGDILTMNLWQTFFKMKCQSNQHLSWLEVFCWSMFSTLIYFSKYQCM